MTTRRALLFVGWLLICPVHASAREPFADDGHRDAWIWRVWAEAAMSTTTEAASRSRRGPRLGRSGSW